MKDSYTIKVGNLDYQVSGPGDLMKSPPSARGFTLKVLERGTGKYATVYKAQEENGYGFIIYSDGDAKLILKGGLGSDHKETIYFRSNELQDIRKVKYQDQDDMEFLRRTCLSGRSWLINLQNKNYYFVAIWNTTITPEQYSALKEYLSKFPSNSTYIQMGMAGTGASSEFQSVGTFTPKYPSQQPKLTDKEKEFVKTAHTRNPQLPAGYAKALKKLQSMTELTHKQWKDSQSTGIGDPKHPVNADVEDEVGKLTAENAEMAQSDITKIIDYSEKLQSMFDINDNLEDWVKAKLNHACDYVATVRDYLKFYRDEKTAGTSDGEINEKWSMKYKRSIDCSNPKGFGQKAHCRARKLRQAGKHTKSTPVKECYKEALQELLKEQDSSMAMGALKQLNSDAKELEIMLQPNTQLEDWVKSKLNLAGEYLDDVYHHLDHFGPDGRKLDEELNELDYTGGVGIHEFAIFFQKASDEDEKQMNHCLKSNNVSCVKSLIQKVTGMTMDKINETLSDEKVVQKYVEYAANSIRYLKELEVIKKSYRRKDDIAKSIRDSAKNNTIDPLYITKSAVDSILIGLGKRTQYSTLSEKDKKVAVELEKLIPVALTHNDGILVKIVDLYESKNLDEDFKKTLASLGLAGLTALGAMTGSAAQPAKQSVKQSAQTVQKSTVSKDASALKSSEVKLLGGKLSDYIANWEGKKNKVYKDSAGLPTIGIGHYLTNNQEDRQLFNSLFGNSVDYNKILNGTQELDDNQIEKLFNVDVKIKEKLAGKKISGFGSLPQYIKNAIISGLYRGDLGPKTIGFINSGDWNKASVEYLNHKNAKTGPSQIQRRMKTNALAFSHYAKQFAQK